MRLIFAIGNPGSQYQYTYHSVGLLLADYLIENSIILSVKEKPKYIEYKTSDYVLIKSKVYMNCSFDALSEHYFFHKLQPENLLVLHDELGLKKYSFKLKLTSGLNGHNGLRDIAKHIGANFAKLSIGIDHPKNFNPYLDVSDYVLSKLDFKEWQDMFCVGYAEVLKWLNL